VVDGNKRALAVWRILKKEHPAPKVALKYDSPFQLLVATILSAQCTDERVNKVTQVLFAKFANPKQMSKGKPEEIENLIRSVGLFRNKAANIKKMATIVATEYDSRLPGTMEALIKLPGVGRKTANVVLGACFGVPGIVVDTHVGRVSNRLELSPSSNPEKIEFDLQKLISKKHWSHFAMAVLLHGRYTCVARNPKCDLCKPRALCDFDPQ